MHMLDAVTLMHIVDAVTLMHTLSAVVFMHMPMASQKALHSCSIHDETVQGSFGCPEGSQRVPRDVPGDTLGTWGGPWGSLAGVLRCSPRRPRGSSRGPQSVPRRSQEPEGSVSVMGIRFVGPAPLFFQIQSIEKATMQKL